MNPAPGTFIRPIGLCSLYAYCLRVERVVEPDHQDDRTQLQCRRFGMDEDRQPVVDGQQNMHYLNGLLPAVRGAWRDPNPSWPGCPRYWREMAPRGQQLEMFS